MKQILKLSTLAGAIVAAVLLPSLVSPQSANAAPQYRDFDGGYYNRGGYARGYGGYSGYGYNPYGNGGYTYAAPRAYINTPFLSLGFGNGYGYGYGNGNGRTYYGLFPNSQVFVQPYGRSYNPYGYGGYGQYGYGGYGQYGGYGY